VHFADAVRKWIAIFQYPEEMNLCSSGSIAGGVNTDYNSTTFPFLINGIYQLEVTTVFIGHL
jgi:hypothetical protein